MLQHLIGLAPQLILRIVCADPSFVYEEDLAFEKAMLESANEAEQGLSDHQDDGKSEELDEMPEAKGSKTSATPPLIPKKPKPKVPGPKAPQPVHGPSKNQYQYFITLNIRDGFTTEEIARVKAWHQHHTEECVLVTELCDSGKVHLHSVITCSQKQTVQVTRKIKTLFDSLNLDWTPFVTCKVKRVTQLTGLFHYLLKDLGDKPPILLKGWTRSWIDQQCKDNLKKIPRKMLLKNEYHVTVKTGVPLMLEFAKRTAMPLVDKHSFIEVAMAMQVEGFCFDNVKPKWLFGQVMIRCGVPRYQRSVWENELQFIEG